MGDPAAKISFGMSFDLAEAPSSWRLEEDDVPETRFTTPSSSF
jgi:hypothetical protein